MPDKRWSVFKSGSDIRGYGIACGDDPLYLSNDVVSRITRGFAMWLSKNTNQGYEDLLVSVGHDSRISAQHIKKSVIDSLSGLGIKILDCGLSSTPAMFMTTIDLKCSGAIQITASHHPYDRNGLKFFTRAGGLEGGNIDEILEFAAKEDFIPSSKPADVENMDYMNTYSANLREMICREVNDTDYFRPLRGYKIVVDAGNGVGGFYATKVLEPLGADVSGSQFLEPDGTFPNHAPNPENNAAMESISSAVMKSEADFGVIFDTDVDRAGCVGKSGFEINRNRLVALAAAVTLENNEGAMIVTDSITSDGVTAFIKAHGGHHLRFKRGYNNVINKQKELTDNGVNCPLAIETSGHASFSDNYFLDDGAYLITKLIIKMALIGKQNESLEDLISTLQEPLENKEIRFKISDDDFKNYGEQIIKTLENLSSEKVGWKAAKENFEGIRVSTDENNGNGWFLLRLSVHDPVMVLNVESETKGGVAVMLTALYEVFKGFDKLDTKFLIEAVN